MFLGNIPCMFISLCNLFLVIFFSLARFLEHQISCSFWSLFKFLGTIQPEYQAFYGRGGRLRRNRYYLTFWNHPFQCLSYLTLVSKYIPKSSMISDINCLAVAENVGLTVMINLYQCYYTTKTNITSSKTPRAFHCTRGLCICQLHVKQA